MTVVSSKEFSSNQTKYYNLAVDNEVFIKRGKNVFHLICTSVGNTNIDDDDDDEDYITMEELRSRVKGDIHQWYKGKDENTGIKKSTAIS